MNNSSHTIRCGLIGFGMIVDETYRPFFERARHSIIASFLQRPFNVHLDAVLTKSGRRAQRYLEAHPQGLLFQSFFGPSGLDRLLVSNIDAVCIATPDDQHFSAALRAIQSGKHVLIEKPSVLSMSELDQLIAAARLHRVLAKVVYHKLLDPDHKRLRTLFKDRVLNHVNSGYCTLLEPKSIALGQFQEWIHSRNPASYVAVHYIKLIDFTFGPDWNLSRIQATGQRGIVGRPDSSTWDSVQLQVTYTHPDHREATFDIHTSWVNPDNFPGYVDQEVQFRFDNAVWSAHQRKRGVEVAIENMTPQPFKNTPNHHYNATFLEPWNERSQRGYGIEVIERFFQEVAHVEFDGPESERDQRYQAMTQLAYNDISSDRNTVAVVQAVEALLKAQAEGFPASVVMVNRPEGGLVLYRPGVAEPEVLYQNQV